jgi:hypothetical protein
MSMTYATLVTMVMDYLDRTDTNTLNEVPNFIYLAEQRLSRETKNVGFETYATGNFITGLAVYPKPANWRRNITFNYGTGSTNNSRTPIELRSYEYLIRYWPDRTQTAPPQFYCDYGYSDYLLAPTPDAAYPFEFAALTLPTPLAPTNQTNWLTNYAPDVLFNATVLEAMYFLKDDERIAVWKEKYQTSLASLNNQDDMRVDDRQTDRRAD